MSTLPITSTSARRAACVLGLAAVLTLPAHAGYHVTAFGGTAGFEEIMATDYSAAEAALDAPRHQGRRFAAYANLCVARLKQNERGAALINCEQAVAAAPAGLGSSSIRTGDRRVDVLTHLYSNRGVARAVNGDLYGAREDFERALLLDPDNHNARRSLDHMAGSELAQRTD